jgi:rSAM/selenodomain-associated transferase 2
MEHIKNIALVLQISPVMFSPMLSIVIPTLNSERTLGPTLEALVPGALSGLVSQLVISDGGSDDATLAIADAVGADVVTGDRGRGAQLARGAEAARGHWLMFLHADTVLAPGWPDKVRQFIDAGDAGRAASFRYRLDDRRMRARVVEKVVAVRCLVAMLPYGDQGLLISRSLYDQLGGYRPMVLMEDVDLVRRIGRRRLSVLAHDAVTSAERYRHGGYLRRTTRNLACLGLWYGGMAPDRIARIYR